VTSYAEAGIEEGCCDDDDDGCSAFSVESEQSLEEGEEIDEPDRRRRNMRRKNNDLSAGNIAPSTAAPQAAAAHESSSLLDEYKKASSFRVKEEKVRVYDDWEREAYMTRLAEVGQEEVLEVDISAAVADESAAATSAGKIVVPADAWQQLHEHQREGVTWLWGLHKNGIGGVLGDTMGLGKVVNAPPLFSTW